MRSFHVIILFLLLITSPSLCSAQSVQDLSSFRIAWKDGKPKGNITVHKGHLKKISILAGKGKISGNHFLFQSAGEVQLLVTLDTINNQFGPPGTLISVLTEVNPFTFFTRDIQPEFPVYIPGFGVAVLPGNSSHGFHQVESAIKAKNLKLKFQEFNEGSETSFDEAAMKTRRMSVPVWLGTSRNIQLFQIEESLADAPKEGTVIIPMHASNNVTLRENQDKPLHYSYVAGRGIGPLSTTKRNLESGVLPILHSETTDDDIRYHSTSFVSREKSTLQKDHLNGTHYLVADHYSYGNMFTPAQKINVDAEMKKYEAQEEQNVLFSRTEAVNTGKAPRYAWFKTVKPGRGWWDKYKYSYDASTGFSSFGAERVYAVSKVNGQPLMNEEIAVLLQPGQKAVFEFYLFHSPVKAARVKSLSGISFDDKLAECKLFWQSKLESAARIRLPEKRIEEMLQAGLLHLDLITYGQEPDGTLSPSIGVYSPIGTESSPIIQFYNSMGWHNTARRSLQYFLDKQHDDGMIQNFNGYMVETGAALWSVGEYFRYTRDTSWIIQNKQKLLKSCEFLLNWRNRNKRPELQNKGYGMIEGKVADPEDPFHQYMLNGYAYLGIARMGEVISAVDRMEGSRLKNEAVLWKKDIRTSFFHSMAYSPVVPLGDGTWVPTAPPWTETSGMRLLYLQPETFYSHGTFTISDAMLGPMYLFFCEVISPDEPAGKFLLDYHSELFYQENSALSQPYYSRHDWVQAKLGLVKPFLKMYYTTMSALADRETYTFWEHYYKVSVHKTHEEAWFLMQTRWMLYLEDGDTLRLLNTAPQKWLEEGKVISIENAASYFGPFSLRIESKKANITAKVTCTSDRKPSMVTIRLPLPGGRNPIKVTGGKWNKETHTVIIDFTGDATVSVEY